PARALPASGALRAENPIELLHRQAGQRVVLAHHDAIARLPAGHVVGTRRRGEGERIATGVALVQQLLGEGDLAADADVSDAKNERRHGRDGGLHVKGNVRAGLILAKALLPILAEIAVLDVVAAPHLDRPAHLLRGMIGGQSAQVPTLGVEGLLRLDDDEFGARCLQSEALRHLVGLRRRRTGAEQGKREQRAGKCRRGYWSSGAKSHVGSSSRVQFSFSSCRAAAGARMGRYPRPYCVTACWP